MKYTKSVISAMLLAATFQSQAISVSGQGTWETTLLGRDINGNPTDAGASETIFLYDTALNITWLRDANYARSNGINPQYGGGMTLYEANTVANKLSVGGFDNWRLPKVVDTGSLGCNFGYSQTDCGYNVQTVKDGVVYSEMANLYYNTLGNKGFTDTTGKWILPSGQSGLTNTATFKNLSIDFYWENSDRFIASYVGWVFRNYQGSQDTLNQGNPYLTMFVRDGDVAAVPESSGSLLGLVGASLALALARRKQRSN
jgi:hypothetical protein